MERKNEDLLHHVSRTQLRIDNLELELAKLNNLLENAGTDVGVKGWGRVDQIQDQLDDARRKTISVYEDIRQRLNPNRTIRKASRTPPHPHAVQVLWPTGYMSAMPDAVAKAVAGPNGDIAARNAINFGQNQVNWLPKSPELPAQKESRKPQKLYGTEGTTRL